MFRVYKNVYSTLFYEKSVHGMLVRARFANTSKSYANVNSSTSNPFRTADI